MEGDSSSHVSILSYQQLRIHLETMNFLIRLIEIMHCFIMLVPLTMRNRSQDVPYLKQPRAIIRFYEEPGSIRAHTPVYLAFGATTFFHGSSFCVYQALEEVTTHVPGKGTDEEGAKYLPASKAPIATQSGRLNQSLILQPLQVLHSNPLSQLLCTKTGEGLELSTRVSFGPGV